MGLGYKKSSVATVSLEKDECVFNQCANRRESKRLLPRQSLGFSGDRILQEVREDSPPACPSESLAPSQQRSALRTAVLRKGTAAEVQLW